MFSCDGQEFAPERAGDEHELVFFTLSKGDLFTTEGIAEGKGDNALGTICIICARGPTYALSSRFFVVGRKYPFWENLVQKIRIVCLR